MVHSTSTPGLGLSIMHQLDINTALIHADDGFAVRLRARTLPDRTTPPAAPLNEWSLRRDQAKWRLTDPRRAAGATAAGRLELGSSFPAQFWASKHYPGQRLHGWTAAAAEENMKMTVDEPAVVSGWLLPQLATSGITAHVPWR